MRFLKNGSIILLLLLLSNCLGTKTVTEKSSEKTSTEKTETKSDSSKTIEINRKIDDVITVSVPVHDPVIDAKIDAILSKINTSKSSGANNYNLSYDKIKREIIAELSIGETENVKENINNSYVSVKSDEERAIETSKKIVRLIPWWLWLILALLLRNQIISIIAIFIPGVRGIHSIHDLLNPPNKNKDG